MAVVSSGVAGTSFVHIHLQFLWSVAFDQDNSFQPGDYSCFFQENNIRQEWKAFLSANFKLVAFAANNSNSDIGIGFQFFPEF